MADFEYAFASSGTPTKFTIPRSGITGIDEAGTITPKVIGLGPNIDVLLTATKTDAEVVTAMQGFINRSGYSTSGAAGGSLAQTTIQVAPALTNVSAAD